MYANYTVPYPIKTKQLVQLITAFRCVYPDLGINLSTRESEIIRDNILSLGITTMSAESSTSPGGYTSNDAEEQFSTTDNRSINQIVKAIERKNLEPVFKDWDHAF